MSRAQAHAPRHLGEVASDGAVALLGSWRYLVIQTIIVLIWIALNVWLLSRPWDPYPLIALNLLFSTQASYAAPLILMAQNRQATRDRAVAMRDDQEIGEILALVRRIDERLSE